MDAFKQLGLNLARSPLYEAEAEDVVPEAAAPIRLFAFYLPQFHPIPENDAWWGKGFTEWTNVTKALPRFEGHYQPHLPSDVGFYDLRVPETIHHQVALAKRYGIGGFCFHWYWFGGRRLLERPLEIFLEQRDLDFPFFINWANENWTRRWDGSEKTVLIEQHYSDEDDIAVAEAFLALMRDPRYLRIDGRPVVMLYRPAALPNARATVARWRAHFASQGERNPIVLMPQVFDEFDPRPYEIDAAVQFPPHCAGPLIENSENVIKFFEGKSGGGQYDYATVADQACDRVSDGYPLIRGVCPGWDNEARKPNGGNSMVGSTPRKYARWLARAVRSTLQDRPLGTNLIFVNAWNEWAEGAHLEPDRHFGHAYLRRTCQVLNAANDPVALNALIGGLDRAPSMPASPVCADAGTACDPVVAAVRRGTRIGTATGSPDDNARGLIDAVSAHRYDGHDDDPFEVAGMLSKWMPRESRVLDIGCGTGSVTIIANRYKHNDVVCIEPDPDRAARAQGRDLYVHCGELDDAFIDTFGRFDVVMMSDVLEHLADPSKILGSIRKVLLPGGTLLVSVPNVAHWTLRLSLLIGRFNYTPTGIRDATHLRWFTAKTIQLLMQENGFTVLKIAQAAGQTLPEYNYTPWRWMKPRIRKNIVKLAARAMPLLFGSQHVLMCRLRGEPDGMAGARAE